MSKETGGPAFPVPGYKFIDPQHFTRHVKAERGQTLRDHFAGLAMQGIVNSQEYQDGLWEIAEIARQSYEIADAMLKARSQ